MDDVNLVALIMAGGSGTRFWPLSQPSFPKQYLNLMGKRSLLQQTVDRILPLTDWKQIAICTTLAQKELAEKQVGSAGIWIFEPAPRNTAPCLMLSTLKLLQAHLDSQTVVVVLPADHFVGEPESFRTCILQAAKIAKDTQGLCTLGITPKYAHTGYGYIQAGREYNPGIFEVTQFLEKPNASNAQILLEKGNCYWNAGIFVWTLGAIQKAFEQYCSPEWEKLKAALSDNTLESVYADLTKTPIDIAVMEKAQNVYVVPAEMNWSDIGSWRALYDLKAKHTKENVLFSGNANLIDCHSCLIVTDEALPPSLIGLENMIYVHANGHTLVVPLDKDQRVKELN